jgi:hypothetical protein
MDNGPARNPGRVCVAAYRLLSYKGAVEFRSNGPTRKDTPMADHPTMDYAEHERTYKMFVGLTKWGTISLVVLLALMAAFLL